VRFYTFEHVDDPKRFKAQYRRTLDALPLSAGLDLRIVEEANRAFELNVGLFLHLDELLGHSTAGQSLAEESASRADTTPQAASSLATSVPTGCPFAKYAAQSGSPIKGMECQRFAAANAANKRASRSLASRSDTSRPLHPILLPLLLSLSLALFMLVLSMRRATTQSAPEHWALAVATAAAVSPLRGGAMLGWKPPEWA